VGRGERRDLIGESIDAGKGLASLRNVSLQLLNINEFGSLTESRDVIEDWRTEQNTWRPRSSLAHPPSTLRTAPTEPRRTTHSRWTDYRDPVTAVVPGTICDIH